MKEKKLPAWISNDILRKLLRSKAGIVVSYWVFQGMLYADYREVLFKIFLDCAFTGFFVFAFSLPVWLSFLLVHTLNMLFNGHVIAMRRHMGLGANDATHFFDYVEAFSTRVTSKPYIKAAAAYGSLTRNAYRSTSDIDVRIIPRDDGASFFFACLFALVERARAFLSSFPMDIYVFSNSSLKMKMRTDEPPMVFHDPDHTLKNTYEKVIAAEELIAALRKLYA